MGAATSSESTPSTTATPPAKKQKTKPGKIQYQTTPGGILPYVNNKNYTVMMDRNMRIKHHIQQYYAKKNKLKKQYESINYPTQMYQPLNAAPKYLNHPSMQIYHPNNPTYYENVSPPEPSHQFQLPQRPDKEHFVQQENNHINPGHHGGGGRQPLPNPVDPTSVHNGYN